MRKERRLVDAEGWKPLPGEYLQTHGRISPGASNPNMDETLSSSRSQSSEGHGELGGWIQPRKEIR